MKKCPDVWLPRTVAYCHAVQSTESDKKENKSFLLLNLFILIKHFSLNIHLLPHSWSVDVFSEFCINRNPGCTARCQCEATSALIPPVAHGPRPLPSRWSWSGTNDFQVLKIFFCAFLFVKGTKLKQWWDSGHFNWTTSLLEMSCISKT